jgi:hypothetical protein
LVHPPSIFLHPIWYADWREKNSRIVAQQRRRCSNHTASTWLLHTPLLIARIDRAYLRATRDARIANAIAATMTPN